jgi:hypothetical protein
MRHRLSHKVSAVGLPRPDGRLWLDCRFVRVCLLAGSVNGVVGRIGITRDSWESVRSEGQSADETVARGIGEAEIPGSTEAASGRDRNYL